MASIQARRNKEGTLISYSIRVYKGRDPETGKQLKPYATTWRPPQGWGEKRAEREARRQAVLFEKQCRDGFCPEEKQTFAAYAEYFLRLKERTGTKHLTLLHYRQCLDRIIPKLGHKKLADIRPQHLNQLYEELAAPGLRKDSDRAVARPELEQVLKEKGISGRILDEDGKELRLDAIKSGKRIRVSTAERAARALRLPVDSLFVITRDMRPLGSRTVANFHTILSAIFSEAEREMLLPYNPARRATPPKKLARTPNYYQMGDVGKILCALETEPIKWRAMVQLLLVSGCRRSEVLGLKWGKIDWENQQIYIDCTLLYARDKGIYEGSPKTRDSVRYIKLPEQTMALLREYRAWQEEQKRALGAEWEESEFVFTAEGGGPMHPSHLGNWLNRFAERRGLPHLNPHAFRHTMTSLLFFSGVDSVSISRRLGHSSVSTTTNIYSHVMEQAESKIRDCVADVLLAVQEENEDLI